MASSEKPASRIASSAVPGGRTEILERLRLLSIIGRISWQSSQSSKAIFLQRLLDHVICRLFIGSCCAIKTIVIDNYGN